MEEEGRVKGFGSGRGSVHLDDVSPHISQHWFRSRLTWRNGAGEDSKRVLEAEQEFPQD